jgi:ribose 5-phosphate isomerase B
MCANKYKGIRAGLCGDTFSAEMTRKHNNANVLCMGARVIKSKLAKEITDAFLGNEFEGGRHQVRIDMMADYEANDRAK